MSLTFWCFKISPKQNPSYIWQVDSTGSRMLPIKQDKPLHLSARRATWWLCITLTQKPSFLSVIAFFFPLFAGRYSAWLKEFNFHLVIFSSRHKRLCDELGERRENLLNAEEGKGMHVLIVGVFAELTHDFEAFIYRHSSLLPGLCLNLTLIVMPDTRCLEPTLMLSHRGSCGCGQEFALEGTSVRRDTHAAWTLIGQLYTLELPCRWWGLELQLCLNSCFIDVPSVCLVSFDSGTFVKCVSNWCLSLTQTAATPNGDFLLKPIGDWTLIP